MKFEISHEEYLKIQALSSSTIKTISSKSESHAKEGFRTISMQTSKIGTALHAMVLENKKLFVQGLDVARSSKADRATWADFFSGLGADIDTSKKVATWEPELYQQTGIYIASADEVSLLDSMSESVLKACPEIADCQEKEFTILFEVDGVECKARFDSVSTTDHIIYDLKTCEDASPKGFSSAVRKWGYHIQRHFYSMAYKAEFGVWPEFKFVAVEKSGSNHAAVYDLNDKADSIAESIIMASVQKYKICTETGVWPGYKNATLSPFGENEIVHSVDDLDDLMA